MEAKREQLIESTLGLVANLGSFVIGVKTTFRFRSPRIISVTYSELSLNSEQMSVCMCVCVCVCSRLLRGHTLLASPPELDIFLRTRCLVPSCECGSRFCRRWQVPNWLCRLHLAPSCVLEGPRPPHPTPSCECGSRFRLHHGSVVLHLLPALSVLASGSYLWLSCRFQLAQ
uniref:Uncharacterized protein n=1 Tax=Trichogramma kaykai TaxID=54128 RepID=A0ABD2WID6_9HYME